MKPPRLVYIAAPFIGPTTLDVLDHVRHAEHWAALVARFGAWPLVPQANTYALLGTVDEAHAYAGTMEMLRRCDGVLIGGRIARHGRPSQGVIAEIAEARRLGIPLLDVSEHATSSVHARDTLEAWVRQLDGREPLPALAEAQ
jgi:nucleoside 2-deoxyribosyltransferase